MISDLLMFTCSLTGYLLFGIVSAIVARKFDLFGYKEPAFFGDDLAQMQLRIAEIAFILMWPIFVPTMLLIFGLASPVIVYRRWQEKK